MQQKKVAILHLFRFPEIYRRDKVLRIRKFFMQLPMLIAGNICTIQKVKYTKG